MGAMIVICAVATLTVAASPFLVFAQGGGSNPPGGGGSNPASRIEFPNPLGSTTTFATLFDNTITFLLKVGAAVATIMILIGAFQMLFAYGDPEKFATGRRTIMYTAIAYGILLTAKGIILIIKDFLTLKP